MHFLLACVVLLAADAAPSIKVDLKRPADKSSIVAADDGVAITITSETGIGAAALRRAGKTWPQQIALQTNLRGLEGCTITCGSLRVQTFLGSKEIEASRRNAAGKWEPTKMAEEFQLKIFKAKAGVRIEIPAAWLAEDANELTVEWVDFYRG